MTDTAKFEFNECHGYNCLPMYNGQWFIVSCDSANKQEHWKKPLHWPQWANDWSWHECKFFFSVVCDV